ncbi:MAG TPA: ZIP family metal transporter [Acidimicrobiales bacterium]|nr:ZIP family metal transporter [Acidimicrobiales bacterium]
MSEPRTLLLGALAGLTILFGLPIGRLRDPRPELRQFLNALAVGVLVFLVWDVLSHAFDPIDTALGNLHDHKGGFGPVLGYSALFFAGIGIGLVGLVYYERRLLGRPTRPGPGAAVANQVTPGRVGMSGWSNARRVSLMVAVGIGLHNFGEGLAIGGSAARGEITLATLLVIGFGLHNATEGFGIVAPLTMEEDRPSWPFLLAMGAIGGGPTIIGTAVGRQVTSQAASVIFLTLAAGSILYVVIQLLGVASRAVRRELIVWGVFLGLVAGFVTDMVVSAAGA